MALPRLLAGTNPDGSPHYVYDAEGVEHIVATGTATGVVELADGSTYDVTPDVIDVASPEHAAEVVAILDGKDA